MSNMTKTRVNWDNAVKIANDLCRGVHDAANENPAVRGQGEVDFIAGCVIAAKFYADNIGASPEQTKELIKKIADIDIAIFFSRLDIYTSTRRWEAAMHGVPESEQP